MSVVSAGGERKSSISDENRHGRFRSSKDVTLDLNLLFFIAGDG